MQIDTDAIEKMAREYNKSLSNYNISNSSTSILERIILISEDQLEIINYLLCFFQTRQTSKVLNYLKTLKTSSIISMNRLLEQGDYIPPFRNSERTIGVQASYLKLVDMQIDVFILLDKLFQTTDNLQNILILENRAMSIISVIGR